MMDLAVANNRQLRKREPFTNAEDAVLLRALREHGLHLVNKGSPRPEEKAQLWEMLQQQVSALSRHGRTRQQCRSRMLKMIQSARKKANEIPKAQNVLHGCDLPYLKLTDSEAFLVSLSESDLSRTGHGDNSGGANVGMKSQISQDDLAVANSRQCRKREQFSNAENAVLLHALREHGLHLASKSSPRPEETEQLWEMLLQQVNAVSRHGRTRAQCRSRMYRMIQSARKKASEIPKAHNALHGDDLPCLKLTDSEAFLVSLSESDLSRTGPDDNSDGANVSMKSQSFQDGIGSNQHRSSPLYQYTNYNNPEFNWLSPEEREIEENSSQASIWNQPLTYILENDFFQEKEETSNPEEVWEKLILEAELARRTQENINKMLKAYNHIMSPLFT